MPYLAGQVVTFIKELRIHREKISGEILYTFYEEDRAIIKSIQCLTIGKEDNIFIKLVDHPEFLIPLDDLEDSTITCKYKPREIIAYEFPMWSMINGELDGRKE